MSTRSYIEMVLWHLDPDTRGKIQLNTELSSARVWGMIDGFAFVIWRAPVETSWAVWPEADRDVTPEITQSRIAEPEDVAEAVRARIIRLKHAGSAVG